MESQNSVRIVELKFTSKRAKLLRYCGLRNEIDRVLTKFFFIIQGIIDKLLINSNASAILVGTSSWREQFAEALRVTVDDDDDDDDGGDEGGSKNGEEKKEGGEQGDEPAKPEKEPKQPTCSDYLIHFISLFWKILFAFVPPTEIWGGWACFVVSIIIIGLLTAVIGDLASHFGCTIGLKDSVTAISFVALGTSLPGKIKLNHFK